MPSDACNYIICTTPRSGSTLLCAMLADTGQAGEPDSFFHQPQVMSEWGRLWGLSERESPERDSMATADHDSAYLRAAVAAGRGRTPVFGMRLQYPYLVSLSALLARLHPSQPTDAARFSQAFGAPRYIHLRREDKVAQAVSVVKARQTGLWHRHADGSELERLSAPATPVYDAAAIGAEIDLLRQYDQAWSIWFRREGIDPVRISYESFASHPAGIIAPLSAALGIVLPDDLQIVPRTARLGDALNLEWAERYRSDASQDCPPPACPLPEGD